MVHPNPWYLCICVAIFWVGVGGHMAAESSKTVLLSKLTCSFLSGFRYPGFLYYNVFSHSYFNVCGFCGKITANHNHHTYKK
jgi:hypothetical protein